MSIRPFTRSVAAFAVIAVAGCPEKSPLAGGDTDALPKDEQLFEQGLAKYDAEPPDYAGAQAKFDQLVADYPDSQRHDNAGYLAGRCRYELADYTGAIPVLLAMRTAHPDSPFLSSAAYFTGRSRFHLADYAAAIADFTASVAADPTATYADNAAYYLGRTHYELGALDDAVAAFVVFESDYADSSYLDNARYYHGRAEFDADDFAAAVPQFEAVLDIVAAGGTSIYDDDAEFYLGRSHYGLAALADALAAFQAVVSDFPTSQYVDNALRYEAQVLADQGDCAAAQAAVDTLQADFAGSTQTSAAVSYLANAGC